jgi:hypothetical protein
MLFQETNKNMLRFFKHQWKNMPWILKHPWLTHDSIPIKWLLCHHQSTSNTLASAIQVNLEFHTTLANRIIAGPHSQWLPIQWTPLIGITLGQTISDTFNQMIPITEHMNFKRMLLGGIWDLINLSHFYPIIQMIPLTVIPLSAHCTSKIN